MKVVLTGKPKIIMSNPDSRHSYFAWPSIARLQNGKLAVVASGFRLKHVCPFGKTVISYSEDEGETYTLPTPVIDTPLDDRDGGILAFGEKSVMVTSFNNSIRFQREYQSTKAIDDINQKYMLSYLDTVDAEEEQKYWGSTFRISHDLGVTFGEILKSPITSPHGPIQLRDGSILWVGRIFAEKGLDLALDRIFSYRVNPDGSMEKLGEIEDIFYEGKKLLSCEPYAFELADGSILCQIRAQRPSGSTDSKIFTTYQSISKDGGRTWSKPEQLLEDNGGAPTHIIRHSSGILIAVYGRRQRPFGIKAMFSADEGKTWSVDHDLYVDEVSSDLGYPATVELSDGSLLTIFYAHPAEGQPAVIIQQKWRIEL